MPIKLYRYRSFNTEKQKDFCINQNEVINIEKWKFEAFNGLVIPSSPLYFNDPYDCELCFEDNVVEGLLDGEKTIQLLERILPLKPEEKNILRKSNNVEKDIQRILKAHDKKLNNSLQNIFRNGVSNTKIMDRIKDAVRVVCLSETFDNTLMWSHYAQSHTGFCIEYNFEEDDKYYSSLYPVEYTNVRYSISKTDMKNKDAVWYFRSASRKSIDWSYEKEWRIIIPNYSKVLPQKPSNFDNVNFVLDLRKNIKAFYLGAKISENFKNEMIVFGRENGIDVYQMVLSSDSYELKAKKIV